MKKHSLDRAIAGLLVLCVLLLAGIGVIAGRLLLKDRTMPVPTAEPAATADTELLMRQDLEPDREKLFQTYDAVLTGADGQTLALRDLRGQPAVLLFWSSWCSDCEDFFEQGFGELAEAAEAGGAHVVLICREGVREDTLEKAQTALAGAGIEREIWMDTDAALYHEMGYNSVPSIGILDGNGQLVYASATMPDASAVRAQLEYAADPEAQLGAYILSALETGAGGVASSYSVRTAQIVQGDTVLSESMGLMMRWAVAQENQEFFERCWSFVRDEMSVNGLTAWQLKDGEPANVNASLDDLRIVEALIDAEACWGGYRREIISRAGALYDACVRDGYLRDFAEFDSGNASLDVSLCYQDVQGMRRLADYDARWNTPAENALRLLSDPAATVGADNPLYRAKYDVQKGSFSGDSVQMSEALIALQHAANAGVLPEQTLEWLEQKIDEGAVYAMYGADGEPVAGYRYESTATYALLVQLAADCGRDTLMRQALIHMEEKRCFEAPMAGGYGLPDSTEHYSFDEMEALLAWQQIRSGI